MCQQHLGLYFDLNSLEIPPGRKRRKFRELLLHSYLCRGKTSPEKQKKNETFLGTESLWKDSIVQKPLNKSHDSFITDFFFLSSKWVFVSKFLSSKNATTSLTKSQEKKWNKKTKAMLFCYFKNQDSSIYDFFYVCVCRERWN